MAASVASSSSHLGSSPSPAGMMVESGGRGNTLRPTEAFPDLHHKMSKKIAQLTKVIYHLNSKNEDHQMDLDAINSNHQNEIEQILRDASKKINKFKDQLEAKKIELNAEAKLDKFRQKYNAEKKQAQEELDRVKQEAKRRSEDSQEEHRKEMASLKTEVLKAKDGYESRLKELREAAARLKDAFERKKAQIMEDCQTEKEKVTKELEEMVQVSNEKYKAMLVEQMTIQDKLRLDCDKRVEQTQRDLAEHWETRMEQLKAEVEAAKDMTVKTQAQDYQEHCKKTNAEHDRVRRELLGKIDVLADKAEKLQASVETASQALQKTEATLAQTRETLQQSRSQAGKLQEEVEACNVREAGLRALLLQKDMDIDTLSSRADDLSKRLESEKQEAELRKSSNDGLQRSLQKALDRHDALKTTMALELGRKDEAIASMEGELEAIRRSLSDVSSSSELKAIELQHQAQQVKREKEAEIQRLLDEAAALREEVKTSRLNAALDKESLTKTIAALENTVRSVKDDMEACKGHMVEERKEHEEALRRAEEDWSSKLAEAHAEADKDAGAREEEHKAQVAQLLEDADGLRAEMKAVEEVLAREKAKGDEDRKTLLTKLEDEGRTGTEQVLRLKDDLAREKEEVRTLRTALEKQINQGELDRLKLEELQGLAEELRREKGWAVDAERATAGERLASLQEAWDEKADRQRKQWEAELQQVRQASEERMAAMAQGHHTTVQELQAQLQEAKSRHESLEGELSRCRMSGQGEVEALRAKREEELKSLIEKHTHHVAGLKAQHDKEMQDAQDHLKKLFNEERERSRAVHREELDRLVGDLQEKEKALQWQLDVKLREVRKEWEEDKARALKSQEETISQAAEAARMQLSRTLQKDKDKLQEDIAIGLKALKTEQTRLSDVSRQLREAQEALKEAKRAHREQVDGMQLDFENNERIARLNNEGAIKGVEDQFRKELSMARQEAAAERRKMDKALQVEDMTAKYHARESRPEDLQRISGLERQLLDADMQKKRAVEEMMYFKLELINREECYNKIFARSPNVGVMQAVKPTRLPAPQAGAGPLSTNTPVFAASKEPHPPSGLLTGRSTGPSDQQQYGGSQHPPPQQHRRRSTMPAIPIPTAYKVQTSPSQDSLDSGFI